MYSYYSFGAACTRVYSLFRGAVIMAVRFP